MTRSEMIKIASLFQSDVIASFARLDNDEMDLNFQLMMLAAATAAVIEASGQPWSSYSQRADEFWEIVRDGYAMLKTMRGQITETSQ